MEKTELWAKACLAEVLLKDLQAEIRQFRTDLPVYSTRMTGLFQQAYRQAAALSATLHTLEELVPK